MIRNHEPYTKTEVYIIPPLYLDFSELLQSSFFGVVHLDVVRNQAENNK